MNENLLFQYTKIEDEFQKKKFLRSLVEPPAYFHVYDRGLESLEEEEELEEQERNILLYANCPIFVKIKQHQLMNYECSQYLRIKIEEDDYQELIDQHRMILCDEEGHIYDLDDNKNSKNRVGTYWRINFWAYPSNLDFIKKLKACSEFKARIYYDRLRVMQEKIGKTIQDSEKKYFILLKESFCMCEKQMKWVEDVLSYALRECN